MVLFTLLLNSIRINFFESIKSKILEINKDYKFATLDGTIKDDVLLCYI